MANRVSPDRIMMKFFYKGFFCLVVLVPLLSACIGEAASAPTAVATRTAAALQTEIPPATRTPIPNATPIPSAIPNPPASVTPIPTVPQPTALPEIRLTVPQRWAEEVEQSLGEFIIEDTERIWHIGAVDTADIGLVVAGLGLPVYQEPIAIAVPFTSSWEDIILLDAQKIIDEGHNVAAAMPWASVPLDHKALHVDGWHPADAAYPLQQSWTLDAKPGYEDTAAEILPIIQAVINKPVIHMIAVGDIMLDRSLGYALEQGNTAYPFVDVAQQLQAADITIGNLETALGDIGEPVYKSYPFRSPPAAAESLAMAGFDIVSLANNHAMDYGPEALLQGIALLENQGIKAIGAGADRQDAHTPAIFTSDDTQIAFLSYVHVPVEGRTGFDTASWTATASSPGLAWANPQEISEDIRSIPENVDIIIVALHSGYEYVPAPSEPQMAAARAAIDAGADLVIGHHAHILQGIEFYGDGVILYGTANFAFEIDGPPETALFDIWLDGDGLRGIGIRPAIVQFGGQPRLASSDETAFILNQIYYQTNLLNIE